MLESAIRPTLEAAEWPGPGEETGAIPLFDSKRGYLEQMEIYKAHQGKATARAPIKLKRKRVPTPRSKEASQ